MSPRTPFILNLTTALHRPVGPARTFDTRDEARAAVCYAFDPGRFALGDAPHFATISHPDGTRETLEFGRTHLDDPEARRARLLQFVKRFDETDSRHPFRLRIGNTVIRFENLTDAALETLAADMVSEFWWQKKCARESRLHHAWLAAGRQAAEAA